VRFLALPPAFLVAILSYFAKRQSRSARLSSCIITRMSIQELSLKFKRFSENQDIWIGVIIFVVGLTSFFLGRMSSPQNIAQIKTDLDIHGSSLEIKEVKTDTATSVNGVIPESGYVASKSGTKYHLPWCGSAKQIKEENKIWFATKEEAEKAGYTPASNCKGI
jgi:hypothetical protein